MISLKNVYLGKPDQWRVNDVSLTFHPGEVLSVVGPNGAGKTSLLKLMSGEVACDRGCVQLGASDIRSLSAKALSLHRAVLPQESSLAFSFKVNDVVLMGRIPHEGCGVLADQRVVNWAMQKTGVKDLAQRDYTKLSGGERQRVHLARVLAQIGNKPQGLQFLLLDEPTAALDIAHQHLVLTVAKEIARALKVGVLAILHDLNLAALYSDRIAMLKKGRLQTIGLPEDILTPDTINEIFDIDVSVVSNPRNPKRSLVISG